MHILRLLNIADLAFMCAGVAITLLMIVMGGVEERRKAERSSASTARSAPVRFGPR